MEKDYKQIEYLLERFFEGETSNEEEKALYDFFAQEGVPEHLLDYKPVIGYFQAGMNEDKVIMKKKRTSKKFWLWATGIAASLLVLFSIQFLPNDSENELIVDGYIIRNGERITDVKKIYSELIDSYNMALEQYQEIEKIQEAAAEQKRFHNALLQTETRPYHEILSRMPEGYAKEEAKKIMEID
jgi:hypothetical protein